MRGKFIRTSFDTMMEHFVRPEDNSAPPVSEWKCAFKGTTATKGKKKVNPTKADIQSRFINHVMKFKLLGDDYNMMSSPNGSDPPGQKPDAGVYPKLRLPEGWRSEWATTRMSIEFKRRTDQDPFDDTHWPEGVQSVAQEREANRGLTIRSATEIFLRQHRCFMFSLVIFNKFARIIRWDRSGALVTERFNYTLEPNKMCEFLWRFGRMSAAQQGCDPSVVEVEEGSPDYVLMQDKAKPPPPPRRNEGENIEDYKKRNEIKNIEDYKREYFVRSLASGWLRYKTPLHTSHQKKTRSFLICKPYYFDYGDIGRGTRGYVAIDCDTEQFVWLKDVWRVDLPGMEKEGDILKKLNDRNVRNIPTVVCHGDILGQRTVTQDYTDTGEDDPDTMGALKAHCHYRLVEYEIGQALEEFLDGYDLVSVIVDCLIAHHDAYKIGILHRDISAGNILIITTIEGGEACQHGLLNDWELAKELPNPDTPEAQISARQPNRTGTWLFLSAASLQDKYKEIVLQDDLESFFHVLLYNAIQYLRSNCRDVRTFIQRFFEAAMIENGEYICGSAKRTAMKWGEIELPTG
ncbi:hypothetical protein B0H21DRAFT_793702, partial [Amylocystis lapponica]